MEFSLADGRRVELIGDPHMGRKFETGVPLRRRGEREIKQMSHFYSVLHNSTANIIITVGDLFDNPNVSREIVLAVARACLSAAELNPDILFIHMAGNHDQPRNLSTVGAWPLFKKMVEHRCDNLEVVDRPVVIDNIAIFPWEWDRRADEQVEDIADEHAEHAVGHWDLAVFDGRDDHLAPVAAIHAAFGTIPLWSGHYHRAGLYTVGDATVSCTGSMLPYAHGEGDMYVTLTRAEALERDDLHDKCVRVILAPGEDLPEIDCLSLTHKREQAEDTETAGVSDDLDFHQLVKARIQKLDPQVREFIEERMNVNAGEGQL